MRKMLSEAEPNLVLVLIFHINILKKNINLTAQNESRWSLFTSRHIVIEELNWKIKKKQFALFLSKHINARI
jgi:hypothetical protein